MARISEECPAAEPKKLSIVRAALTGSLAASILYALCWLAALLAGGATGHMYLQLFTDHDPRSALALMEGAIWSWVFGSLGGSLVALAYNALAALEAR